MNTEITELVKHYEHELSTLKIQNSILHTEITNLKGQLEKVNKKNIELLTKVLNQKSSETPLDSSLPEKAASNTPHLNRDKIQEQQAYRNLTFIMKLPNEERIDPYTKETLTREKVRLAVYNNQTFKGQYSYVSVDIFSNNRKGAGYIGETEIKQIKNKAGKKKYIDIRDIGKKKKPATKESHQHNFAWPSTELSENPYTNENQELNGKSELRERGYQITGMSTVKRWEVLERAVPESEMGLRKIAYTIAFLVKSRKGQANGEVKFKYAINEWEKDLDMLKERYYKKDFTWPST